MDNLTAVAASGMRSRMQALEILANNMANSSSRGYKADKESFNLYSAADATNPKVGPGQEQPWIDRTWVDFTQGTLEATGNQQDLGLVGKGFLTVRGPGGNLYTRNGSLRVSAKGDLLAAEERPVLDNRNQPIRIDSSKPFDIDRKGEIRQDGATVAQLGIVEFPDPAALVKAGQSYFQSAGGKNVSRPSSETEVHQGKVEASNAGPAEAAVRLVSVMRQFEMLQKAISIGTEMNRSAIDQIAKVNP
jgi:flagellar basal-body rod protein FlgF